jgi:phage tail-like protein
MRKRFYIFAVMIISACSLLAQNDLKPGPGYYFRVKIDNITVQFQEVSGLDIQSGETQYRKGNNPVFSVIKMPGMIKNGNVTMKKGWVANGKKLNDCLDQLKKNTTKRKDITVELLDEQGKVSMAWTLKNAWVTKTTGIDVKNTGTEMTIETIDIAHEGISVKN